MHRLPAHAVNGIAVALGIGAIHLLFGAIGGLEVAHRLARANLITNKNLIPSDGAHDWDHPSGLRMGTIEITRLGMGPAEMTAIADFIAQVLIEGTSPEAVAPTVTEFRRSYQTLYYCSEHPLPPQRQPGKGLPLGDEAP